MPTRVAMPAVLMPTFVLLAQNDLADDTRSSPVVSDGQSFVRTGSIPYAIGQRRVTPPLKDLLGAW